LSQRLSGLPPVNVVAHFGGELAVSNQRKRIWIDRFQTRITLRILFYCVVYQLSLWMIITALQMYVQSLDTLSGQPTQLTLWALVPILAFLGLITIDAVRYMHRLVGPMYRFRKTIQAITAGEPVDPVQLRRHDFLQDIMKDFNDMLNVLEQKGVVVIKDRQMVNEVVGAR
jgi:hypothetical protein